MKYSVLMSVYNKENPAFLQVAVDSMLKQSMPPDEIVIVKDGCLTDKLEEILVEYVKKYPTVVHVVGYENNHGLGYALNFGLERCHNDIVARMDTDDIAVFNRCEKQLRQFVQNPLLDIISGKIDEFINNPSNIVSSRIVPIYHDEIVKYMKKRCPFNHVAVMFKKKAVQDAGGYIDCFWNEDYYLWIRMFLNNAHFANLSETMVFVRIGKDMYKRRGGIKYFKSELFLQNYMFQHHMISKISYFDNVIKRLIVQVLLPNYIRGLVFKIFAR